LGLLSSFGTMRGQLVALPDVGSDVYVIGHPDGLGWTITRCIISAVRRPAEVAPDQPPNNVPVSMLVVAAPGHQRAGVA